MKIPKHVRVIGKVHDIGYRKAGARTDSDFSFWETTQLIAVNPTKTALYMFPQGEPRPGRDGMQYDIPTRTMKKVGSAVRIIWFWDEKGESLWHSFQFGRCPALYADRYSNPRVLALKYARGCILTERGIK